MDAITADQWNARGKARRPARARVRNRTEGMNKLEAKYAAKLDADPDVAWFVYESVTLKLAKNTRYTPDFFVQKTDGSVECHECKGFWEDDARVKIKCAAEKFPMRFVAVQWKAKQWQYEVIGGEA